MLLADYQAYVDCQQRVSEAYRDRDRLDAHVDSQHRARRPLLVGPLDPRVLPRHLARRADDDARNERDDDVELAVARASTRLVERGERAARRVRAAGRRQLQRVLEGRDAASNCCCSTTPTPRSRRGSSRSIAKAHRTYHYWHAFVPGSAGPGLRLPGARAVRAGTRAAVRLREGAARSVRAGGRGARRLRPRGRAPARRQRRRAMKSVVADPWPLRLGRRCAAQRPFVETVIYELHVRGFTQHPSSGVAPATRGTYAGLIEKIPYLEDLGVTAVELLPVFQFDPLDAPAGRSNYWGYQPVSFFAPHHAYSSRTGPLGVLDEFRDMVKALHRAGIEVILDVVFNHTTEGGRDGPTFCYRGLANDFYYILAGRQVALRRLHRLRQHAERQPADRAAADSGQPALLGHRRCTSTASASTSRRSCRATRRAARCPTRRSSGTSSRIPLLAGTKLIAEAWDAAGLYQVGSFVGDTWQEWNGRFRDDVRRFVRGDERSVLWHRGAAARQPRHLRPRGTGGRAEHQLRDLPRRLHAQRSRLVQPEAQRGQRRGQSRRLERQPELELRRRRADRRSRRSRRCATARSRTSSR